MDGQKASIKRGLRRAAGLPLLLLVCLVNLFFLCLRYPDVRLDVQAGDVLAEDVTYPFTGADAYRTDELRQAARDRVQPVYRLDETIVAAQEQALTAWFGQYDLVQSFTCSPGLHDSTPHGVFLDGHPLNRWHYFKKFYCWAQYSFEIEGDILFHSVIYSSNNENSLRSGSLYALGNPASHCCVRLSVSDAKWLFEHCKYRQNVIIVS